MIRFTLPLVCAFCLLQFGCKKEKELVSLASNVGFSAAQSATEADAMLITALDIAQHFKNPSAFNVIPSAAKITYVDSSFMDGTGVRFLIDFGAIRREKPKGMQCLDGKFRAGIMECSMSLPFQDSGNKISAIVPSTSDFYTGNGTEMFQILGNINLFRTGLNQWDANEDLEIDALHLNAMTWRANLTLAIGSESHSYTGSGSGLSSEDNTIYSFEILDDWVKMNNCPNTFIQGTCDISAQSEVSYLDFNPYNDQICDEVARVSLNRFEKIFYLH